MRNFFLLTFAIFFLSLFAFSVEAQENKPPVADANGPYEGVVNKSITFDGSGSADDDGDSLTYSWDFGDGNTGKGQSPSHTYSKPGIFTVTLVVNDGLASSTPTSTSVRIALPPPSLTYPNNETRSISFPLELDWEDVEDAKSYFYQVTKGEESFSTSTSASDSGPLPPELLEILEPNSYESYAALCREREGKECSDEKIQKTIIEEQIVNWEVKSCWNSEPENPEDLSCGSYSESWNFAYMPLPPELLQPSDGASDVTLPVTLEWTRVENVKSYKIDVRVNIECNLWDLLTGFFNDKSICNPMKSLTDPFRDILGMSWFFGSESEYDPSCPWKLWNTNTNECVTLPVLPEEGEDFAEPKYIDDTCVFSKNTRYLVSISSCLDPKAKICGEWSEERKFTTGVLTEEGVPYQLEPPTLIAPEYDPAEPLPIVGKKDQLRWESDDCASYVSLYLRRLDEDSVILEETLPNIESVDLSHEKFTNLWNNSSNLDKEYVWKIKPCWRVTDDILCEEDVWSEEWHFKTIGAPPPLLKPESEATVKVPVMLEWKNIDGAGSYRYQVATDSSFQYIDGYTVVPRKKIDYPEIKPDSQYWWRVKTCADEKGEVCGEWNERDFKTYPIGIPKNLGPATGTLPATLKWDPDPGAHFYEYMVDYASTTYDYDKDGNPIKETLAECQAKTGSQIISPTVTRSTNLWLGEICLGKYNWRVRSCLEESCTEGENPPLVSDWSNATYIASEITGPPEKGIVPCGRRTDIRTTPYDEREQCQFKHLGFLLQNILDFLLWRLGLVIVAIMAVVSGVTSYFSLDSPTAISQIKTIWKSVGKGYGIILIAWLLVNLILGILGYQVEFFGKWWQLPF